VAPANDFVEMIVRPVKSTVSGIGVHLRYGRASQVWACISGMGVHLRYGRASQVWACLSGMDVHLRYMLDIAHRPLAGVSISHIGDMRLLEPAEA
jgi:hypothetical protein